MANHSATEKSIRKTATRTQHRRSLMSAVKTSVRQFQESLASGNKEKLEKTHKNMQSQLMKAAKKNLMHKNTVSRKIARLTKKLKSSV
ncbi:MAG: 30S ribosomal protein S20 [Alphaproteobacteria bacterium]|jgi:small subunit ribosomal protein S20|nr:MAG: 30S ribosomal protein S20 [Alphaproteobacteria bacterium]